MLPLSVNIVTKSFQAFMFYDNIITLNEVFLSSQQIKCSCKQVLVVSELEPARHKIFDYAIKNLNAAKVDEEFDHFFNNLKYAAKGNPAFRFILEQFEIRNF